MYFCSKNFLPVFSMGIDRFEMQMEMEIYLPDDKALIRRFLAGDQEAYTLLYRKYVQELFSYGKSLAMHDDELLKDAIQDVFYKMLSSPALLEEVQNIRFFLFRALKNRLIDLLKKESHEVDGDGYFHDLTEFTVETVTVQDNLIEEEERQALARKIKVLLNRLTPRQREAVCLRYIHGLEYDEIADLLNMDNAKSAVNLVSRAITALRKESPFLLFLFFMSLPCDMQRAALADFLFGKDFPEKTVFFCSDVRCLS